MLSLSYLQLLHLFFLWPWQAVSWRYYCLSFVRTRPHLALSAAWHSCILRQTFGLGAQIDLYGLFYKLHALIRILSFVSSDFTPSFLLCLPKRSPIKLNASTAITTTNGLCASRVPSRGHSLDFWQILISRDRPPISKPICEGLKPDLH